MKKNLNLLLVCICSFSLIGCGNETNDSTTTSVSNEESVSETESSSSESESTPEEDENKDEVLGEDYTNCTKLSTLNGTVNNWKSTYSDGKHFSKASDVTYCETYVDNQLNNDEFTFSSSTLNDVRSVYYTYNSEKDVGFARYVDRADGIAMTIPTDTRFETDFSLGKYRAKLYDEETTITISYETSNPYSVWSTYRKEWLFGYLDNEDYYTENNLVATADPIKNSESIVDGYYTDVYSLMIDDPCNIRKYYYNIACIRTDLAGKEFTLVVMKSTEDQNEIFEWMLSTYKKFNKAGRPNNNSYNDMEVKENPNWSDETKRYYEKLLTQDYTGWGFFTGTYPTGQNVGEINVYASEAYTNQKWMSEQLDYDFDILPTYQHTSWYKKTNNYWPSAAAENFAGGNGFNGKPVIQFSYQFTDNNNTIGVSQTSGLYTPIFDIYRGSHGDDISYLNSMGNKLDTTLRMIARQIKSYGKPVLFRLNNEMNSDWTSYCGMMSLLDPDIFQATWRIMYNIFEEEGVDNCIWIFNPIAKSCPYSSWGEDMCYFPGNDYVQALGLTYYEDNNSNDVDEDTFEEDYTILYEKNNAVWNKYPWIISEFGCGAGGSDSGKRYRNQASQVNYINGMFADFEDRENNPYLQNIKGAVWFSCNDGDVTNQYEIDSNLPLTIAALKAGLAANKVNQVTSE